MDRREAIRELKFRRENSISVSEIQALDLAIEALEREIEYGQMVVDFTKGETTKSDEWQYDTTCDAESATTTDCISRADIEYHTQLEANGNGQYEEVEVAYKSDIDSLPPVIPPRKVVAEIKVDTEELVKRIKEEYQIEQEHGRLIDVDKLLQDLFIVDEEEWTTPEIRAILENAPTIITPTERIGEWVEDGYYDYPYYVCSNCGQECGVQGNGVEIEPLCTKYCPNCGAKMKE